MLKNKISIQSGGGEYEWKNHIKFLIYNWG